MVDWLGRAIGHSHGYFVILAQTIVNEENVGLNWFLLQLRDLETGKLLPGVVCGDVGPKAGRDGLDNGWIQLQNVVIPRMSMLMSMCQIDSDGNVTGPIHPALMYATLIPERFTLAFSSLVPVGQALTIAFDCLNCSAYSDKKQIYTFQLSTALCCLVSLKVAEKNVMSYWNHIQILGSVDPTADEYIDLLPDIHAVSAGLKAYITAWAADSLPLCQQAVGIDAKYGAAFGTISRLVGDFGVLTTGGGDNYTLLEQLSRSIFANLKSVIKKSGTCVGSMQYMNKLEIILSAGPPEYRGTFDNSEHVDYAIHLIEYLVVLRGSQLVKIANDIRKEFWKEKMVEFNVISVLHVVGYVLKEFRESLSSKFVPKSEILPVLNLCGSIYAVNSLVVCALSVALEEDCLTSIQARSLKFRLRNMVDEFHTHFSRETIKALGHPEFVLYPKEKAEDVLKVQAML
ncbi:fatty-acyl coenzyme A oxidase [Entophlyctis luteolus]|nr:fatty-acyl coenzyme A oxidase [Entophlyctis luteolus]